MEHDFQVFASYGRATRVRACDMRLRASGRSTHTRPAFSGVLFRATIIVAILDAINRLGVSGWIIRLPSRLIVTQCADH